MFKPTISSTREAVQQQEAGDEKPVKAKTKKEQAKEAAAAEGPVGHNSGSIPAVDEAYVRILTYDAQIKSINAAKKEERNKLKTEYGLLSDTVAIELKLRKKSPEVRAQIEANVDDLQVMLGRKAPRETEYADPSRKIRPESIQKEG